MTLSGVTSAQANNLTDSQWDAFAGLGVCYVLCVCVCVCVFVCCIFVSCSMCFVLCVCVCVHVDVFVICVGYGAWRFVRNTYSFLSFMLMLLYFVGLWKQCGF